MSEKVRVHIGTAEDIGRRFIEAWHRAEQGEAVDEAHITFHDLPALLAALTPRRLDLLRHVRHHQVRNVRVLAADLHRDYKNVHQDVESLVKLGLLTRSAQRVEAPFGEIDAKFVL